MAETARNELFTANQKLEGEVKKERLNAKEQRSAGREEEREALRRLEDCQAENRQKTTQLEATARRALQDERARGKDFQDKLRDYHLQLQYYEALEKEEANEVLRL